MSFRYRIVQTDGREYYVSSDLSSNRMVDQEKKAGRLKEMFLSKGIPEDEKDAVEKWERVYPGSRPSPWY